MYPLKFKAAILSESNQPLIIDDVVFNGPLKFGQVLVKVGYSGICGKQIEEITARMGDDPFLPHLLGHEGFGEVIDCGAGIKTVSVGDKVIMHWMKGAGIDSSTPDYLWKGQKLNAGWITTFNEYAVVSENRLTAMPDNIDGKIACLLGCAVTTGIGAVVNEANTRPHHKVAVVGCGGVGLNCIFGAKAVNASKIVAYDTRENSKKLALEIGADEALTLDKKINTLYDKVFVATGSLNAIELGFNICKEGGQLVIIGVPAPNENVQLNALDLHRNKSIIGSNGGGVCPEIHIPAYYKLHKNKVINLNQIIEDIISLDQINNYIDKIIDGEVIKRVVIKF